MSSVECTCDQTYTCKWHQGLIDARLAEEKGQEALEDIEKLKVTVAAHADAIELLRQMMAALVSGLPVAAKDHETAPLHPKRKR